MNVKMMNTDARMECALPKNIGLMAIMIVWIGQMKYTLLIAQATFAFMYHHLYVMNILVPTINGHVAMVSFDFYRI
jgi:hypothetical protein